MNQMPLANTSNMVSPHITGTTGTQTITNSTPSHRAEVAGAGRLDRAAVLQQVYQAHVEQIYRFIFFKVGNREDAEDLTSQVFIKAANSLDVSQEAPSRLAWLYQVARTTITDHWRGYYKGVTTSLDAMEEESPMHLAADPVVLGTAGAEELDPAIEKVRSVLALLPENYRRVLQLRFLNGCSLKETAAAMQVTEANAKVIQHRAIQKALKVGAELI